MSDAGEDLDLLPRLQRLQSRFTWDIKKDDLELDDLSRQLQHDIDLSLGQCGAVAHSYSFMAYVRYLQGQLIDAESLLSQSEKKARECFGEACEWRLIVSYGDLAWLNYHREDYKQSQTYCEKVDNILVYGEKAWTFLKFSKSYYPKAIECFSRALELEPDNPEWNNGYAIALYRTEKVDPLTNQKEESPATKQLRRAVEKNPVDPVLLSMLALQLTKYQKHNEAEHLVNRALKIGPDDTQVIRYVAKYFYHRKQIDRCIDLLESVTQRESQSAFIHHHLGRCYKAKIQPIHPGSDIYRHLAIESMEKAVRLKSTLNYTKAELALLYAEDYKRRRAQEMFDEVLEKLGGEPEGICQFIHWCYAEFCYQHTNNKDLGITYYRKVLKFSTKTKEGKQSIKKLNQIADERLGRSSKDTTAYAILAEVAKAQGDKRRAAEYYEKALERDGSNEEYLSALCELRLQLDPETTYEGND